jgi:hypothetical protein
MTIGMEVVLPTMVEEEVVEEEEEDAPSRVEATSKAVLVEVLRNQAFPQDFWIQRREESLRTTGLLYPNWLVANRKVTPFEAPMLLFRMM